MKALLLNSGGLFLFMPDNESQLLMRNPHWEAHGHPSIL